MGMSRARTKQIEAGVEKEYEAKGRSAAASKRIAGAVMGDIKRERALKKTPAKTPASRAHVKTDENMLGKKCTIEAHRPCELDTGIAFARDISAEAGVPVTPKLKHIIETKKGSESQIQAALEEWKYSMPSTMREEADWLYDRVFPQHK